MSKFSWFPFFFLGFQVFLDVGGHPQQTQTREAVGKKKEKKARENKKAD